MYHVLHEQQENADCLLHAAKALIAQDDEVPPVLENSTMCAIEVVVCLNPAGPFCNSEEEMNAVVAECKHGFTTEVASNFLGILRVPYILIDTRNWMKPAKDSIADDVTTWFDWTIKDIPVDFRSLDYIRAFLLRTSKPGHFLNLLYDKSNTTGLVRVDSLKGPTPLLSREQVRRIFNANDTKVFLIKHFDKTLARDMLDRLQEDAKQWWTKMLIELQLSPSESSTGLEQDDSDCEIVESKSAGIVPTSSNNEVFHGIFQLLSFAKAPTYFDKTDQHRESRAIVTAAKEYRVGDPTFVFDSPDPEDSLTRDDMTTVIDKDLKTRDFNSQVGQNMSACLLEDTGVSLATGFSAIFIDFVLLFCFLFLFRTDHGCPISRLDSL